MKWVGLIFIALLLAALVHGKKGSSKATTASRLQTKKVTSKGKSAVEKGSWEEDIDKTDAEPAAVEDAPKETRRFKATEAPTIESFPGEDGPDRDSIYHVLARHVVDCAVDDVTRRAPLNELERAIRVMASAQAAWKSVDGATHQLKNTIKARYASDSKSVWCVVNLNVVVQLHVAVQSIQALYRPAQQKHKRSCQTERIRRRCGARVTGDRDTTAYSTGSIE